MNYLVLRIKWNSANYWYDTNVWKVKIISKNLIACCNKFLFPTENNAYYGDVIMGAIASQITSLAYTACVSNNASLTLQWRHNELHGVPNHQPHDCLLNRLFRRRSKKTPKLHVTGLCAGNSPGRGEFPAQMANNAENVSIWWRHHECRDTGIKSIHNIRKDIVAPLYAFDAHQEPFLPPWINFNPSMDK